MEKRLALYVEIRGVLAILRGSEDLVKKGAKFCFGLPPPPGASGIAYFML